MAKGSWAGTASSAELVAVDNYREYLTIQLTNDITVALGFGEAAVVGEGIQLMQTGDTVTVRGHLARSAVNVIGNTAIGTYQSGKLKVS